LPRHRLWRTALTVAGSDSGGGAGLEADLKTFTALGVHGLVAVTSVTAQNTVAVTARHDIPASVVVEQIRAVVEDIGVDAAKTGMLGSKAIVEAVAAELKRHDFPLVVDPVMVAKSGARLLDPEAEEALKKSLIPRATVVTPNRMEAEELTGYRIRSVEDAKRAARLIVEELGAEAAVVKGGHLGGPDSVDVLYYRGSYREYRAPRIPDACTHGTGCCFSAAIAAMLAKGLDVPEAVAAAKRVVTEAIRYGARIGHGHCPVNPAAVMEVDAERYRVLARVSAAVERLVGMGRAIAPLVPEVGMNIAEVIDPRYARGPGDAAAVKGRIVRYGETVKPVGPVEMGASSHMARAALEASRLNPSLRAALNIRYTPEAVEAARSLGLLTVFVDREQEPEEVRMVEGRSIQWIIREAFRRAGGRVPDVVYDTGAKGREAMIRILARDALEAVDKLASIASRLSPGEEGG